MGLEEDLRLEVDKVTGKRGRVSWRREEERRSREMKATWKITACERTKEGRQFEG
jgi:hypothetical protein